MPNEPDVGIGKEKAQVVDQFLNSVHSKACSRERLDGTYDAIRVKEAVFDEGGRETWVIAPSMKTGPVIAVAYGRKDPGEVDTGTAAGEQQVVVEFVLFGRGTL